jgi:hypothetical protein
MHWIPASAGMTDAPKVMAPKTTPASGLHQPAELGRFRCRDYNSSVTSLLRQAIAEIEELPAEAQDAIATRIMAELADDRAWERRFSATTDEQWERLAQGVRREIAAGSATPLDEVFPPGVSEP